MSEFKKALAKSKNVESAIDEIDKDHADVLLLFDTISEEFKDWQPPKPLVEVPQFVADWFENARGDLEFRIWQYIREWDYQEQDDFYFWFNEDSNKQTETLVRMKLEGYTVKKEQLYVVWFGFGYLIQNIKNKNMVSVNSSALNFEHLKSKFTEKEIKAIDERYWQFAVKVDEDEE